MVEGGRARMRGEGLAMGATPATTPPAIQCASMTGVRRETVG